MTEHNEAHPPTAALNLLTQEELRIAAKVTAEFENAHHKPTVEELGVLATIPRGSGLLICTSTELEGARFLLNSELDENGAEKQIVVGRSPDSDVFLDDVTVSRQHAVFTPNAGSFAITDNNSLNGTYLNGDRVDTAFLMNGSEIQIGKYIFAFFLGVGE
ncbi:FHA domain-containing protein [Rothia sp. P7181]|uniref:FHA domain-containing protein n=1 Tax=unclassified Rothia (in: high G+C Gram-positive bacteria) TaxID=2689056 RepID=UPI003AC6B0CE